MRTVRRGVPGRLHLRAWPRQPARPSGVAGERYGYVYEINFLRCIHCDLCVEACPTEAITESKLMEFSFTNRNDAIYTKAELLVDDDGKPQHLPWEDWREGDDLHTSGWMRATSPAGAAEFEGEVQWSGELGLRRALPRGGPVGPPRRRHHRQPAAPRHPGAPPRPGRPARRQAGPRGAIGRMLEKAERFAPGAGKKHREKADADYAAAAAPAMPSGTPRRRAPVDASDTGGA